MDAKSGEKVEKDEMIKGYEFAKGQYVTFTPEEIKSLEEKSTGSIDVAEFVPAEQVDRLFFDKAYFLGPGKGGERAYKLLAQALQKTGRAAIGQYAARGKQYLVMLRPMGGGLVMETLHYADEVRAITDEPTEAPQTQIIDLMEALKASLAKGGLRGAGAAERKPARRAARAR